jgi:tetratricopeptide (TPR) repeat protein
MIHSYNGRRFLECAGHWAFGLAVVFLIAACQGGVDSAGKAPKASGDAQIDQGGLSEKAFKKGQSSVYYYFMSLIGLQSGKPEQADRMLDLSLKENPQSGFLWSQKAYSLAQKNDWDAALQSALQGLAKDPKNKDSLILVGKLYAAQSQPEKAVEYYQRALKLDPKNEEIYNIMAREYLSLDRKNDAVASLKHCAAEIPEAVSCLYYLATLLKQLGHDNEAVRTFGLIEAQNPGNIRVLESMGEVYLHQKNYKKALEVFGQIKQLNPTDFGSAIRVGLIYYELKDIDKAIAEFQSVAEMFPDSDRLNYFLGLMLLEKKDLDTAFTRFSKVGPASAFYLDAVMRQGLILKDKKKLSEAIALVDRRLDKAPSSAELYDLKVSFHLLGEDLKGSLAILNEGLGRYKNNQKLLFQRATVHDRLGSWNDAKQDLLLLVKLYPDNATALNYLGYSLADKGEEMQNAFIYLTQALKAKPGDGFIMDSLGWWHYKNGDTPKALELLHKAATIAPDEPTIHEHLGDIYLTLKNKRSARVYFESALKLLRNTQSRTTEEEKQLKAVEEKLAGF